ncbi:MAG: transposase, partial [Acidimicrobiales bacterium]|nr:transposase [Acidimicrobiales bacterium]
MERQYVAIDLHRLRSLIVREDEAGEEVGVVRIDNDPFALAAAVADAGPEPEVAIEATYGWYWAVDVLEELGAHVRLVNPSGLQWGDRRVKNDYKDCKELLDRMRLHKLPEAWIAPPPVRELRELVRYRHKLVCLRTGLKAQVKAVLAKHGLRPPLNDLWGPGGRAYLNGLELDDGYHIRVESLRDLVEHCSREVAMLERVIHQRLRDDAGYRGHPGHRRRRSRPGRHLRHRDRRRHPLPEPRGPVLVGRADTQAPGVRHQGPPGTNHQTGLGAGALGRHRDDHRRTRRAQDQGGLPTHCRPARHPHRPGSGGPQAPHARLL